MDDQQRICPSTLGTNVMCACRCMCHEGVHHRLTNGLPNCWALRNVLAQHTLFNAHNLVVLCSLDCSFYMIMGMQSAHTPHHAVVEAVAVLQAHLSIVLQHWDEHIRCVSLLDDDQMRHPMQQLASLSTAMLRAPTRAARSPSCVLKRPCPAHCDVGNCIVLDGRPSRPTRQPGLSTTSHLVAGALAGIVSRTATAPLETVRLCSMTGTRALMSRPHATHHHNHLHPVAQSSPNVLHVIMSIAHRDGWRGLFRGNAANVLKSAPQKAIDFFAFEAFKASPWLQGWSSGPAATLTAAGMAGATSASILYPLEVLRSRITCDPAFAGASVVGAARAIVAKEGLPALYRGWLPAVAAIVPEAAIVYGCFDLLKRSYARVTGQQEAGMAASLAFGVTSSFLGQMVSYPLETVSRRMQLAGSDAVLLHCAQRLWASEGVAGFYRGLPAATARTVPMVCVWVFSVFVHSHPQQALFSFATYELVRRWLLALEEQQQPTCVVQQSLARHSRLVQ